MRPFFIIEQQLALDGFLRIGDQMCGERLNLRPGRVTSDDRDLTGGYDSLMSSMNIGLSQALLLTLFGSQHQSGR